MVQQVIERDVFGKPTKVIEVYSDEVIALSSKRDIGVAWIEANCVRQSNGWLLKGVGDGQQMYLDNPIEQPRGKHLKYITPKGSSPGVFIPIMPNETDSVLGMAERSGYLCWTEGIFKSIKATSVGIPTVAGMGVNCLTRKDDDGKYSLIDYASQLVQRLRVTHLICYDADLATNHRVQKAVITTGEAIEKEGRDIRVVIWEHTGDDDKGMDDAISKYGVEWFRERLEQALTLEEYKEHCKTLSKVARKGLTPNEIGENLAELLQGKLLFDPTMERWWQYERNCDGVWSETTLTEVHAYVATEIKTRFPAAKADTPTFIKHVTEFMSWRLIETKWGEDDSSNLIPFQNGVLDVNSSVFSTHAPSYRLTWSLPRSYMPGITDWSDIKYFLSTSLQGKDDTVHVLNCFAAAVLRRKYEIQKYLHLIGAPGSGKGTFTNLLMRLVGKDNIKTGDLAVFCTDKFDTASAFQKRLIMFNDQQPYSGNVGTFLNATGGEMIRYERKGKDATSGYIFKGLALMTSNYPVFTGSNLGAVQRRQILVSFDHVPPKPDTGLLERLSLQLPAWTNYLLSIPESEIERVLSGRSEEGRLLDWETYTKTSSLAAWLNECVCQRPEGFVPVGNDIGEISKDGHYVDAVTAFGSYNAYCRQTGQQPIGLKNFSPNLMALLTTTLRWLPSGTKTVKKEKGMHIPGIVLRGRDEQTPTISEMIENAIPAGKMQYPAGSLQANCRLEPAPEAMLQALQDKSQLRERENIISSPSPLEDGEKNNISVESSSDPADPAGTIHSNTPTLQPTLQPPCSILQDEGIIRVGKDDDIRQPKVGDKVKVLSSQSSIPKGQTVVVSQVRDNGGVGIEYRHKKKAGQVTQKLEWLGFHMYEFVDE